MEEVSTLSVEFHVNFMLFSLHELSLEDSVPCVRWSGVGPCLPAPWFGSPEPGCFHTKFISLSLFYV